MTERNPIDELDYLSGTVLAHEEVIKLLSRIIIEAKAVEPVIFDSFLAEILVRPYASIKSENSELSDGYNAAVNKISEAVRGI